MIYDRSTKNSPEPPGNRQVLSNKADRIVGIDTLRLICACWVMLSHLGGVPVDELAGALGANHFVVHLLAEVNGVAFDGTAAVIVFFIISGFCIHLPNVSGKIINVSYFWMRRMVRVGLPVIAAKLLSSQIPGLRGALDPVLWSLYCELFYYAIYPGLLSVAKVIGWEKLLCASFLLMSAVVVLVPNSFGFLWGFGLLSTWVYGLPYWISGAVLASRIGNLSETVPYRRIHILRVLVWLASCTAAALQFHSRIRYTTSMVAFAPLACFWFLCEIRIASTNGSNSTLEQLGKGSYSLYLIHPLVLALIGRSTVHTMAYFVLGLVGCTGASVAFFFVVERPAHRLARRLAAKFGNSGSTPSVTIISP